MKYVVFKGIRAREKVGEAEGDEKDQRTEIYPMVARLEAGVHND